MRRMIKESPLPNRSGDRETSVLGANLGGLHASFGFCLRLVGTFVDDRRRGCGALDAGSKRQ